MSAKHWRRAAFPLAVAAALASATASGSASASQTPAQANPELPRNLFEILFPDLIKSRIAREEAEEAEGIGAGAARRVQAQGRAESIDAAGRNRQSPGASVSSSSSGSSGVVRSSGRKGHSYRPAPLEVIDLSALIAVSPRADFSLLAATGNTFPLVAPEENPASEAWLRISPRFPDIEVMAESEIGEAVAERYARERKTLWLDEDLRPNAKARSVLRLFREADEYALDPDDYLVSFALGGSRAERAARFEIEMTARAIRYAMDARDGRINPNRLSGYHDLEKERISAEAIMSELDSGALPVRVLLDMHPSHAQFLALRDELARLTRRRGGIGPRLPSESIRLGSTHPRAPDLLAAIAARAPGEETRRLARKALTKTPFAFGEEAVSAVRSFQSGQGLSADGIAGPATLSRLRELGPNARHDRIRMAMERLRWHPREFGERYVFVNQPSYRAAYVEDGSVRVDMRAIIGTRWTQTSFFHDVIERVEYNPYWTIPRSILVGEYLPKLRADPSWFDARGYRVFDEEGNQVPSASVDWSAPGSGIPYKVRQLPGRSNALGELKIMFPNVHAIYMHDTPERELFEEDRRAFSHGCIRLHRPREMAAALLGKSVEHVAGKLGQGHGRERVEGGIPVYVAYFTAWPDEDGKVEHFADVYGRDSRLSNAFRAVSGVRSGSV